VSTDKGELKVEFLDPDTGKPIPAPTNIDVKVNGQRVVIDPDGKPVTVRAGEDQLLVVTGEDFITESQTFTLKRWKDATVRVTLVPKERLAKRPDPVVPPPEVEPGPKQTPEVKTPPKPVTYPKDKTLVAAGGYETLLDATKEQMQAWLDEKKKAGHSVLWLDAGPVVGKPVYSAVAALDDRQPKWQAMLDVPADEASDTTAMRKRIDPEQNTLVAVGGFESKGDRRVALLWVQGRKRWVIGTGETMASSVRDLATGVKDGMAVRLVRPFEVGDKVYVNDFCEVSTDETPYAHALTAGELDTFLAEQRKGGAIPSAVSGYVSDGLPRFAVVCRPNTLKVEWEYADHPSAANLAETVTVKHRAGYRPASVTAYAWDGAVRYCVVWVKDPPKDEKKEPKK
jgi:hypothetical protein